MMTHTRKQAGALRNKVLVMIALFGLIGAWLGFAVLSDDTDDQSQDDGVAAIGSLNTDNRTNEPQDAVIVTTNEGTQIQYSAGNAVVLPADWPTDVPVIETVLTYSASANAPQGGSSSMITFDSPLSPFDIVNTYTEQLTKNGWGTQTMTQNGQAITLTARKDARTFNLYVTVVETGTTKVSITLTN